MLDSKTGICATTTMLMIISSSLLDAVNLATCTYLILIFTCQTLISYTHPFHWNCNGNCLCDMVLWFWYFRMENSGAWLNIHLCQFWCFMSHSSLMQRFFFCWDWMEVCVLRKWLCAEKPRTLEKAQRHAAALSAVEERKLWVCEWNQDPFRNPFSLPLDFSISPYSNLISFQLYNFFHS